MSVIKALDGYTKAKTDAKPTFTEHINHLLKERGMKNKDLAIALYGANEDGTVKNSGNVSTLISGRVRFSEFHAERWANILKVSPESLLRAARNTLFSPDPKKKNYHKKTPAQLEMTLAPAPVYEEVPFMLTLNKDGTTHVRLNLMGLPVTKALKIMEALELTELIPDGSVKRLTFNTNKE